MGIAIIYLLVIIAVGCLVQGFLSRVDNKYAGYILPILNFIYSIVIQVNFAKAAVAESFSYRIEIFIGQNIFTVLLLVIYFLCRRCYK